MATIISSKTTGGGGASITGDTSGILQLASADGTTAVTIDASQNVGIGVTGLSIPLAVAGKVAFGTSYLATYIVNNGATNTISQIGDNATFGAGTNFSIGSTAQYLGFNTVGTERMRIDSSGNVGIGTNTITQLYGGYTQLDINGASGTTLQFQKAGTTYGNIINDVNAMYLQNNTAIVFGIGGSGTGTERMRIDSSGNVLVGDTTGVSSRVYSKGATAVDGSYTYFGNNSAGTLLFFVRNDGVVSLGSAANSPYNLTTASAANVNIASSGTLFRSTSSIKYKTDVEDAVHGLDKVMELRPVTYKGINDGDTVFGGLIAEEVHEAGLSEFVQYAEDGSPDSLAYGQMVSLAFKAIQELKAIIDTQQTRITALEAK